MKFDCALYSDAGIVKKTNQDSMLLKEAETDYGRILLAAVCDGMGGLSKGEVASANVINALSEWFEYDLPELLYGRNIRYTNLDLEKHIHEELERIALDINRRIYEYGRQNHTMLGSTLSVLLLFEKHYYILNIGDSRIYKVFNSLKQLTKDQSLVQQKVDRGEIAEEDMENDPQRNVLLQCIGATSVVKPDFYSGIYEDDCVFLLCSDGFRHVLTKEELFYCYRPQVLKNEAMIRNTSIMLVELNKQRMEKDNISVIAIHAKRN